MSVRLPSCDRSAPWMFFALLLGVASATPACLLSQTPLYRDESVARGVLFQHVDTSSAQTMGGGAAFFDFDADGDEDLFVASSDGKHKLFEKRGAVFVDRTAGSGLDQTYLSNTMGVIAGDYNQDGLPDLFLCNYGYNELYTNLGGGKFREDSTVLGLDADYWSVSASWADFDRDGDLDLYIGNYVGKSNFPYHIGQPNQLFINNGPGVTPRFAEVGADLGVDDSGFLPPARPGFPYPAVNPQIKPGVPTWGCALSICTQDVDLDGDQDILVGNDFGEFVLPNRFYRNDTAKGGPLQFTDVSVVTGFANNGHYNMGISGADYDLDGDWDFYMTNLGPNILHQNQNGRFVNVVSSAGPVDGYNDARTMKLTSWGTVFQDLDNDLWPDLFIVNGFINGAVVNRNDPDARNHLWFNQGNGTFQRFDPATSGVSDLGAGRGVAAADVNGDGFLDFYVMNNGGAPVAKPGDRCRLFVNQAVRGANNHWSQLLLRGTSSNLEAIGATLRAEVQNRTLLRQVLADPCYASSGTRRVHFGLGGHRKIDRLVIDWPSEIHQEIVDVPADRQFDLLEPRVTADAARQPLFGPSDLSWVCDLRNHSDASRTADVVWQLRLTAGGPVVLRLVDQVVVPPQSVERARASLPVSPGLRAALSGLSVEQTVYVVCDGAVDCRRRMDQLR